jgi:hypothetical protein
VLLPGLCATYSTRVEDLKVKLGSRAGPTGDPKLPYVMALRQVVLDGIEPRTASAREPCVAAWCRIRTLRQAERARLPESVWNCLEKV